MTATRLATKERLLSWTLPVMVVAVSTALGWWIGGMSAPPATFADSPTLSAQKFTLLRADGTIAGTWECSERETSFRILDVTGKSRLKLGLNSASDPEVSLLDATGERPIFIVQLVEGKPRVVLSDAGWEGRVILGHIGYDQPSKNDPDSWGLQFRSLGEPMVPISLGYLRTPGDAARPWLTLRGAHRAEWSASLEPAR